MSNSTDIQNKAFLNKDKKQITKFHINFYSFFEYGDVHLTGDTEGDFVVVDSFLNRGFGGSGSVEAPKEGGNGLSFIAAIKICGGMALAV